MTAPPERVAVTDQAAEMIRRLVGIHGPVMFHQSGGCCDGSSPMCYPDGEFRTGASDVLLGHLDVGLDRKVPMWMSAAQFEYWKHTHLTVDLVKGRGAGFSLEAPEGVRFLIRSRIFTDDEFAASSPSASRSCRMRRMTEFVKYSVSAGIATLTFDSPHNRNALSRQLLTEFRERMEQAASDTEVKVVVIRAEGRTFCSGADLSEASSGTMEEGALAIVDLQRQIVGHPKPVVTRLHGAVRAGGIGIVAASDVAISADDATFALTEVKLGLAPAGISLTVLPRMTSRAAAWACLTGEKFTGAQAAEMGLVTKAVPEADLDAEVDEVCRALASGSPQGLRETKGLLNRPLLDDMDTHGPDLAKLSARLFESDEARDAMLAFLSRTK